jgi:hypothetical protein
MRLHFLESLNPCIRDLANLLRPKILPFAAIKFIIESDNMAHTCHINEGVAYIAIITEIYWQIKEVIGADRQLLVQGLLQ